MLSLIGKRHGSKFAMLRIASSQNSGILTVPSKKACWPQRITFHFVKMERKARIHGDTERLRHTSQFDVGPGHSCGSYKPSSACQCALSSMPYHAAYLQTGSLFFSVLGQGGRSQIPPSCGLIPSPSCGLIGRHLKLFSAN